MPVSATVDVQMEFSGVGSGWTSVKSDVRIAYAPIKVRYGIEGWRAKDRTASTGIMTLALNNGPDNSAATTGYYSPDHASVRSGFAIGIRCRLLITYSGTTYYKFVGTVDEILPVPGNRGPRAALVRVVDWMDEAARAKTARVAIQIDKRGDQIMTALIAQVSRQPISQTIGTGRSTFPYALDSNREEGLAIMQEVQRVTLSEAGYSYLKGNTTAGGELVWESRTDRATKNTNLSTFDNSMIEMELGRRRSDLINRMQVVMTPRRVDSAATSVLFKLTDTNAVMSLGVNETKQIVCPYTNPADRSQRVGGTAMVTPAATTDYLLNSVSDGSGSDLTASLSVAATFGANAAFLTLTNNHATLTGYVTKLELRGKGIYVQQEAVFEQEDSASQTSFGENVDTYVMPYESNPDVAEGAARYFLQLYKDQLTAVTGMRIHANKSDALMTAALAREVGDRIGIAETVSGITTTSGFFIQSVDIEITPRDLIKVRWGLSPAARQQAWLLGTVGASELGSTTNLGF